MESEVLTGLALTVVGGVMQGSFTLPMKFTSHWAWENTWLAYATIGLLILPAGIAAWTVPHWMEVYQRSASHTLLVTMACGVCWGAGSVLFGLAVSRIGMALTFALVVGLTAAIGSLAPLVLLHPEEIGSTKGQTVLAGLAMILLGLCLCTRAGKLKEVATQIQNPDLSATQRSFGTGLMLCLVSGLLSSMLNVSFAFGGEIAQRAVELGASVENASNAIWVLAVSSGYFVNAGYCFYLLFKHGSWTQFGRPGTYSYWLQAATMGALWMFGILAYGIGAARVGHLGPVIGWPLFMAAIIITANLWSVFTGAWKGSGEKSLRMIVYGILVLTSAIFVIGYGSSL